jgi:hypothetical protein
MDWRIVSSYAVRLMQRYRFATKPATAPLVMDVPVLTENKEQRTRQGGEGWRQHQEWSAKIA